MLTILWVCSACMHCVYRYMYVCQMYVLCEPYCEKALRKIWFEDLV